MLYAMPGRSANQRFVGLAFVGGVHVLILLALLFGLKRVPASRPDVPPATIYLPEPSIEKEPDPIPLRPPMLEPSITVPKPPVVVVEQTAPTLSEPAPAATGPASDSGAAGVPGDAIVKGQAGVGIACPNSQAVRSAVVYPAPARREGIQGDVLARFVVGTAGQIKDIAIVQSAHRTLNPAVIAALREFQCLAQPVEVTVEVPFSFRLD